LDSSAVSSGGRFNDVSHKNEETLRSLYDAFGRGDVGTVMGFWTDDIEFHISGRAPVSGEYRGKDEVLGFIGKLMELSQGTFRIEVLDILANDEHGVALTIERGQRQEKTLENRAVHVWEMRNGRYASFRGYNENVWDEFWS
jgi:ketosteroid isomerase-like protein